MIQHLRSAAVVVIHVVLTGSLGAQLVTTADDVIDFNDNLLSLREAVLQANANPGIDTIELEALTYRLRLAGAGEDAGLQGDLDVTEDLIIVGKGLGQTIVDADELDRVLHVLNGCSLQLVGVTIRKGRADHGGGVFASGPLILFDCEVSSNVASAGGGIFADGPAYLFNSEVHSNRAVDGVTPWPDFGAAGGGIFSETYVLLWESEVRSNTARSAIYEREVGGGGIAFGGTLRIIHSGLLDNLVQHTARWFAYGAGAACVEGPSEVVVRSSAVSGNVVITPSYAVGGGFYCREFVDLDAADSTMEYNQTLSGYGADGGFFFGTVVDLAFQDCVIRGNRAGSDLHDQLPGITSSWVEGGAICLISNSVHDDMSTLRMTRCLMRGNVAQAYNRGRARGGAIFSRSRAPLRMTLTDCELLDNQARGKGERGSATAGALFVTKTAGVGLIELSRCTVSRNLALAEDVDNDMPWYGLPMANGGAIAISSRTGMQGDPVPMMLLIDKSTLNDNRSVSSDGVITLGGAISQESAEGPAYTILTNCTLSGNGATLGGAIHAHSWLSPNSHVVLTNSTLTANENHAIETIESYRPEHIDALTYLQSTLIAGNTNGGAPGPDIHADVVSWGFNLVGDGTGATGFGGQFPDFVGNALNPIDPLLGPLQDNGGPTRTHALDPSSPAIDRGLASNTQDGDQRLLPRKVDGDGDGKAVADIGAYEVQ